MKAFRTCLATTFIDSKLNIVYNVPQLESKFATMVKFQPDCERPPSFISVFKSVASPSAKQMEPALFRVVKCLNQTYNWQLAVKK